MPAPPRLMSDRSGAHKLGPQQANRNVEFAALALS